MNIPSRPTEMIKRQLSANRYAARYRNHETGSRTFAHILPFRPHFVREMIAMRKELIARGEYLLCAK
jgi:hypothetical protein